MMGLFSIKKGFRQILRLKRIASKIYFAVYGELSFKLNLHKKQHSEISDQAISDFIKTNSEYWINDEANFSEKEIWVEGLGRGR